MKQFTLLLFATILLAIMFAGKASAFTGFYTNEAAYLSDLALYSTSTISEGFEGTDWDGVRYPTQGLSVTSQGLTWIPFVDSLSTVIGWARTGNYGVFDSWGDPDHLVVTPNSSTIVGLGGWFSASTATDFTLSGAGIAGAISPPGTNFAFLGIINSGGLGGVDLFTSAGHWGADDFTIGTVDTVVPEPITILLFATGLLGMALFLRKR